MVEQIIHIPIGGIFASPIFALIPSLFLSAIYFVFEFFNIEGHPPNRRVLKREYDFIIVGSGSSGAVIANRLSENPNYEVLLLEAGGDENTISDIPGLVPYLQLSEMDWKYRLEPSSTFCLGMAETRCPYPRGRVLGGSSTLNYMMYVRGNKKDYDGWADQGNYGWSFDDVLPYFKKSEDNRNLFISKNKKFHSRNGELTVKDLPWRTPLSDCFVKAGVELGYYNLDFNSRNQTGFMIPQATMRGGSRCSTGKAFIRPAAKRQNLDVAKYAFVTKVLVDTANDLAYGIQYYREGASYEVHARKEIILSAGAMNTPQILMLSGIGPREHLEDLDITVIKDLPVGFNLQDHIGFGMTLLTDERVTLIPQRYENLWTTLNYIFEHKGPLTALGGCEAVAFVNSKYQDPAESYPDLQLHLVSGSPASDGGRFFRKNQHLSEELWKTMFLPIAFQESFTIIPILLRPISTGRVMLRSANPLYKPKIIQNYFSNEDDVRRLIDGARITLKLLETKPFQRLGVRYHFVPIPICPNATALSDEYFECLMRYYTIPSYHASGTVKMGPEDDRTAVVNPELRVHGILGLRVADASIMPKIISGNTNAPAIMIGEKASALILNFWKKK